jgi:hypothetical protein
MTLLASGAIRADSDPDQGPQVETCLDGLLRRHARHSFRRASLYGGCDSARQRAGKCRAGRGGSICHADQTFGRFAVGQEPSRSSGTKLGGGMAFHFFTRSDRRLPDSGTAGATWDSRSISSAFAIRGTQPREILERGA